MGPGRKKRQSSPPPLPGIQSKPWCPGPDLRSSPTRSKSDWGPVPLPTTRPRDPWRQRDSRHNTPLEPGHPCAESLYPDLTASPHDEEGISHTVRGCSGGSSPRGTVRSTTSRKRTTSRPSETRWTRWRPSCPRNSSSSSSGSPCYIHRQEPPGCVSPCTQGVIRWRTTPSGTCGHTPTWGRRGPSNRRPAGGDTHSNRRPRPWDPPDGVQIEKEFHCRRYAPHRSPSF